MTARRPGDAWGAAPLSRMNEPAPAIPATRRQTVETRAGFRVKAAKSRNCTLNPCFPAIITGLRGSFSNRGDTGARHGSEGFAQMPANRENPGVDYTARQSRDREGALANSVAGMRSLTVAAPVWAPRAAPFFSRAPGGAPGGPP